MLLAGRGHDLVRAYRSDHASAQEVVRATRESGARVVAFAGDISDNDHVTALFAAAAQLGPITGLVNNAGLTAHIGDLADTPVAVLRHTDRDRHVGQVRGGDLVVQEV